MLRVTRTRPPLRLTSICSPALDALKSSASAPDWPSTVSLASPGSHWKRSSPAPSRAVSAPRLPSTWSSPFPPSSVSAPSAPRRSSAPSPPSSVSAVSAPMPLMPARRSAPARPCTVRDSTATWLTTPKPVANVATTSVPLRAMPISSSPSVPRVIARSAPSPPSMSTWPGAGHARVAGDRVGLAERRDAGVVLRLGGGHLHVGAGAVEQQLAGGVADAEAVRAVGPARGHRVGRGVGLVAARAQVDVDQPHAGAREVADRDVVGAAERAHARGLEAGEVHGDRRDVAGQAYAVGVGADVDLLTGVGAVEVERVVAALALDGVAVVARIPAGSGRCRCPSRAVSVPRLPSATSSPGPPISVSSTRATAQVVVAAAAVERERRGERAAGVDDDEAVVAAVALDLDLVEGAAVGGELGDAVVADVDRRRQPPG